MQKEEQRFRNLGRIDGETKLFGKNWEKIYLLNCFVRIP